MTGLVWSEGQSTAGIERQWRTLRQQEGESHGRALALNLVCRAHDVADAERMSQCLWELGPRHPARVFLITPGAAQVQLRVAAHAGGSELVDITVSPDRALSVVLPLLAADLPVVLLWRNGDPTGSAEFVQWAAVASRVLVDAHRMKLEPRQLDGLAAALPAGRSLTDLTWTRLTPWRQLLCQGLESAPELIAGMSRVTIAAGSGLQLASLLFAGWLAEQLEWSPELRLDARRLQLRSRRGTPLELAFEPGGAHEALLQRLVVSGGEVPMTVAIEHHGPHVTLAVEHAGASIGAWSGACSGAAGLLRGERETLCEELSITGGDSLFQRALARGLELERLLTSPAPGAAA